MSFGNLELDLQPILAVEAKRLNISNFLLPKWCKR